MVCFSPRFVVSANVEPFGGNDLGAGLEASKGYEWQFLIGFREAENGRMGEAETLLQPACTCHPLLRLYYYYYYYL